MTQKDTNTQQQEKFHPGQLVDVNLYDDVWKIGYGRILWQDDKKQNHWVWEMQHPGHDGCCWAYSYHESNLRLTQTTTK